MHRPLLLILLMLLVPLRALAADWMAFGHGFGPGRTATSIAPASAPCPGHGHTARARHADAGVPAAAAATAAHHGAHTATHDATLGAAHDATLDSALQPAYEIAQTVAAGETCADEHHANHAGCTSCDICHGTAIAATLSDRLTPPRASVMNLTAGGNFPDRKLPPGLKPPIA